MVRLREPEAVLKQPTNAGTASLTLVFERVEYYIIEHDQVVHSDVLRKQRGPQPTCTAAT